MPKKSPPNGKISQRERQRLLQLIQYEEEMRKRGIARIAGIDEAGRGPLAGPVVAAACVIPAGVFFPGVDDSKKLTPIQRERLYDQITSHPDVSYGVGCVSSQEVDRINIYQATIQAMLQAVDALSVVPEYLFVDGMQLPHPVIPCLKIVQGDAKSQVIAAASVIAKVTRDRMMCEYHLQWPQYGFEKHKGYGTEQHLEAIAKHGACPIHRMTFAPLAT